MIIISSVLATTTAKGGGKELQMGVEGYVVLSARKECRLSE